MTNYTNFRIMRIKRILTILSALVFSFGLFAQSNVIQHVDALTFNKMLKSDRGVLIDVRTPREFNNGHIEGAVNINLNDYNFREDIKKLPRNMPIYVYCHSGNRSKNASIQLYELGYTKIVNLSNGIIGWNNESLPLIKSSSTVQSNQKAENTYTQQSFNELLASSKLVFIDFYADWCVPCKEMSPMMEELKKEYSGKLLVQKVNTDSSKELVKLLKINAIPYLVLYKDGIKVYEKEGKATKEELVAEFKKYIN